MNTSDLSQVPFCPGGTPHTIRAGDTLAALAGRFSTSVEAITAANPGIDPFNLQIGQVICIPGPAPGFCPAGTPYTIRPGDTLYLIARRFNITLPVLIAANPGIDPLQLQVGQNICVPVAPPPVHALPCCAVLQPAPQLPPNPRPPFTALGVFLFEIAGAEAYAATFTATGLPDPAALGDFDAYEGRITIPAGRTNAVPTIYGIILSAAQPGQPTVWAGARLIPEQLTEDTAVAISPFNRSTGTAAEPVLSGTFSACH